MGDIPLPTDPTTDDVDLAEQTLSSVTVDQNQPIDVSDDDTRVLGDVNVVDNGGTVLDLLSTADLPLSVNVSDDDARVLGDVNVVDDGGAVLDLLSAGDLPLSVDADTTPTTAATTSAGEANAAQLDTAGLSEVEVLYDTSGAATVTVETSTDGNDWYQRTQYSPGSAVSAAERLTTGARYVRVFIDTNVNQVEVSSKGV